MAANRARGYFYSDDHIKFLNGLNEILLPFAINSRFNFFPEFVLLLAGIDKDLVNDYDFSPINGNQYLSISGYFSEEEQNIVIQYYMQNFPGLDIRKGKSDRVKGWITRSIEIKTSHATQFILPVINDTLQKHSAFISRHKTSYGSVVLKLTEILRKYGIDSSRTDAVEETICKVVQRYQRVNFVKSSPVANYFLSQHWPKELVRYLLTFVPATLRDVSAEIVSTKNLFQPCPTDSSLSQLYISVPLRRAQQIVEYFAVLLPGSASVAASQERLGDQLVTVINIKNAALLLPKFLKQFEETLLSISAEQMKEYRQQSKSTQEFSTQIHQRAINQDITYTVELAKKLNHAIAKHKNSLPLIRNEITTISTQAIQTQLAASVSSLSPTVSKIWLADLKMAEAYLAPLNSNAKKNEKFVHFHARVIAKLMKVLEHFKGTLPYQQKTLNVISLGCGELDDFAALKLFIQKYHPQCVLNYVGIDIAPNATIGKLYTRLNAYHTSPHQTQSIIKLITGDASNPVALKELLIASNALPEKGFDLILLRHPELVDTEQGPLFERMTSISIPFLAHEKSVVYVSVYQSIEAILFKRLFNLKCYTAPMVNEFELEGVDGISRRTIHDIFLEPESYSLIRSCRGYSYNAEAIMINNRLFHAINDSEEANNKHDILRMINSFNYDVAFMVACTMGNISMLNHFLLFKNELGINLAKALTHTQSCNIDSRTKSTVSALLQTQLQDSKEEPTESVSLNLSF